MTGGMCRTERFSMENVKSDRERAIADLSVGLLAVAVFLTLITAAVTIFTKGRFESLLKNFLPEKMPVITRFFVFTPIIYFVICFTLVILILISKELFVRAKRITLAINVVVAIAAMAYYPLYIIALYLPAAGS